MMSTLTIVWSIATILLVVMLIYRALLANKEDDQLFLGQGEEHMAAEQNALIGKLKALGRYSLWLGLLSGLLLLTILGIWTYEQFTRPPLA